MRFALLSSSTLVLAAYLAGCSSAPTSCDSSRDCSAAGLVCDLGQNLCVECVVAGDCLGAGEVCRQNQCATVTPCVSSRECPGQVCNRDLGYCVDCIENLDCTGAQICEMGFCVDPPTPCTSDRECSAMAQVCDIGRGVCADCVRDGDCLSNEVCRSNSCVPGVRTDGGPTIDGGRDGGPLFSDAGRDAGRNDAGRIDAGRIDAGRLDSGRPDAGRPDAGRLDAGRTDGGIVAGLDVMLLLDLTGSLRDTIATRSALIQTDLVQPLQALGVRVGVAYFGDFPVSPFGSVGDRPFEAGVAPTTSLSAVSTELASMPDFGGGDAEESTIEALSVLTGGAVPGSAIPFSCPVGTAAGGCWTTGSARLIVVITDVRSHNGPDGAGGIVSPYTAAVTAVSWASTQTRLISGNYGLIVHFSNTPDVGEQASIVAMLNGIGQGAEHLVPGSADWTTSFGTVIDLIRTRYGL